MIDSLKTLQTKRTALKREINGKEADLHKIWDDLFHKKEENLMSSLSPTKRIMSFISSSTVVIDGMLLGWKLYNRFGKKRR
jgi:hypothetical protein